MPFFIFMRTLAIGLLALASLSAQPVYLSAHGKTFHKTQQCMSLARATHVYSAEQADAEKHGLHQCAICYREKKAGSVSGAAAWATETAKQAKVEAK